MGSNEQGFDSISSFPTITKVRKRTGELVPYDIRKIEIAVFKAMKASGEGSEADAQFIARCVQSAFQRSGKLMQAQEVTAEVESLQDAVERELMQHGFTATAKHYILYREKRAATRRAELAVPAHVRDLMQDSKQFFRNDLAEFIYFRSYSRWIELEGRRETWVETVDRYMNFMRENLGDKLIVYSSEVSYDDIREAILSMEVMPSMRLMWSAGDAARATNVAAFNCAYIAPEDPRDFADILYILACGCGVGFSCESQNVQELPVVSFQQSRIVYDHEVEDSKEGWADALFIGMKYWYEGRDIKFDVSKLRPEGARLKTMGGRSSGPKPLVELLFFVREKMLARQGRRLTNIDVHDIVCKIGDCIVAGGVRRSALISLSDLDDVAMRDAKKGYFYMSEGHRSLANNSAVYTNMPDDEVLLREWLALVESRSGERGIFNRGSLSEQVPQRRRERWEEMEVLDGDVFQQQVGCNPCGEIYLVNRQFCNLTEVVCRADDTLSDLIRKVKIATILGTYQATLTNYPYIDLKWKHNAEAERLLGVSLTGQWDCSVAHDRSNLATLREHVVQTNKEYAKRFGIPESTATTCVKPSGTVSQLVDSSSGMHPRYAPYYIRRVRIAATDPLFCMLKDQGVPYYPEVGQTHDTANTFVLEFPVKAPEGVDNFHRDVDAFTQLEHWKMVKENYTEHNPSVTVSVDADEWIFVLNWLKENWEIVGGLSFLPKDDHIYQLAPYEAISKEKYEEMCKRFEGVDYSKIVTYECEDNTEGSKELACVGGVCEI
jgi:ribonucleoside-triphosphate reductase